jgi:hypothetical protein
MVIVTPSGELLTALPVKCGSGQLSSFPFCCNRCRKPGADFVLPTSPLIRQANRHKPRDPSMSSYRELTAVLPRGRSAWRAVMEACFTEPIPTTSRTTPLSAWTARQLLLRPIGVVSTNIIL